MIIKETLRKYKYTVHKHFKYWKLYTAIKGVTKITALLTFTTYCMGSNLILTGLVFMDHAINRL